MDALSMKLKALLAAAIICASSYAHSAPYSVLLTQRNSTDTGQLTRTLTCTSATSCVFGYDYGTQLPTFFALDASLTYSSGVLGVTSGTYATSADLSTALANYTTTTDLNTLLGGYVTSGGLSSALSSYVTSSSLSTTLSGYATTTDLSTGLAGKDASGSGAAAQAYSIQRANHTGTQAISTVVGLQAALDAKFANPSGTTAQYLRGDGSLATFPTAVSAFSNDAGYLTSITSGNVTTALGFTPSRAITLTTTGSGAATFNSGTGALNIPTPSASGTVTSVGISSTTLTVSGSPVTSSGSITVNLPTETINDAPGRTLVTSTSATGYQISSTKSALACYEGSISTTSTIGGPSSGTVVLETATTNSTTPGDWTVRAQQTYSNTITLAVVLNQVQGNNWAFCRKIAAGLYVRLRSSVTGTASVTLNTTQNESY